MATYTTAQLFGSPNLAKSVEWQESRGDQNAISPKGAFGVMQLMPGTASDPGFGVTPLDENAPDQEAENRRVGTDYLNAMLHRYGGDQEAALVAYNWGPGNADKWIAGGKDPNRLPAETRAYVQNVTRSSQEPMRMGPPDAPQKKRYSTQELFNSTPKQEQPPEPAADFFTPGAGQWEKPSAPVTAGGMFDAFMNKAITEGAPAVAGLPSDAIYGARWLARKAGLPTVETPLPGSQEISAAVKKIVPEREPQNVAEEYAGTVGAFAPSAALGAGGLFRRGAQVVVPALLSETGGQIGRQFSPEAETAGRIGGALLGGKRVSNARLPKGPATTEGVKDISQAAYDTAEAAGLRIKGDSLSNFISGLMQDKVAKSLKYNPELHKNLTALSRDFEDYLVKPPTQPAMQKITGQVRTAPNKDVSLEEFDNLRRNVLKAARSPDADERRIAGHMLDRMDGYFNSLKASDVKAGNLRQAQQAVKEARKNWAIYRKSDTIDTIMEVAKDRAGQFSVSGNENAIRTGFRQLSTKIAKDPREARRWTEDEKKIIRQLSRGWHSRDALKNIGAILNNRFVQGGAAGLSTYDYMHSNDPDAIMLSALGFLMGKGARSASGALAGRKVNQLSKLVRGGGQTLPGGRGIIPLQGNIAYQEGQ